ncbi:hypothetical protein [Ectothiorhodospira sp. BSL-9]|uniref:hypothetical protein n=1 Tax=Ectothiorhodospira sp. BSL-9 TaxID=1442136 RepID=UPI0007B45A60|nr:hypothetical protein [Ectothiorhodospira sp. BSL-9]ANB01986.1 hypothetical protein ECTOBSL9_1241 [Ectothiorhodospira sp. BSL-9]
MVGQIRIGPDEHFASLARRTRLLILLSTAEVAGLTPIPILKLHAFAYLSNVLAPVWELHPLDGKILKRRGGPFYPRLQLDLDRLVGFGLAHISGLDHLEDEGHRWRLEGSYQLYARLANPVLRQILEFPEEDRTHKFIQELAYALAALDEAEFCGALAEDATYADPLIDSGKIVDFAEWRDVNFSANAASSFDRLVANGRGMTSGEKIHLYVRHLHRKMDGRR